MIKRKKHQQYYWTEKTDKALERYIKWETKPHIQQRIFQEHIEIPLRNISRRVIGNVTWKEQREKLVEYLEYENTTPTKERENLVDECVSFFFTTLLPYIKTSIELVNKGKEKTIQSNFAYINYSIRIELLGINKERTKNSIGGANIEDIPYSDTKKDYNYLLFKKKMYVPSSDQTEFDSEALYINDLLSYWDKNIPLIWKKENQGLQRTIAENVIELMRRSKKIKHFKVDSMRRYLRKMMDWDSGTNIYNTKGSSGGQRNKFNRVIRFMRDRNDLLRSQYKKRGMIDFYYI